MVTASPQAAARPQAPSVPQAPLPWRRLSAHPPPPRRHGDTSPPPRPSLPWRPGGGDTHTPSGRKRPAGAPEVPGRVAEAEAAAAAVSFWAVTPGRHHGGRGLAGAAGLGADRALAAPHVREGAGAGKGRGEGGVVGNGEGTGAGTGTGGTTTAACPRRRWGTSRCRPLWGGTFSGARSTSCPVSSLTVSQPRWHGTHRSPPPACPAGTVVECVCVWGGVPRGVTRPRCPQPSTS